MKEGATAFEGLEELEEELEEELVVETLVVLLVPLAFSLDVTGEVAILVDVVDALKVSC